MHVKRKSVEAEGIIRLWVADVLEGMSCQTAGPYSLSLCRVFGEPARVNAVTGGCCTFSYEVIRRDDA